MDIRETTIWGEAWLQETAGIRASDLLGEAWIIIGTAIRETVLYGEVWIVPDPIIPPPGCPPALSVHVSFIG